MKSFILVLILAILFSRITIAQSYQLEVELLAERYKNKEFDQYYYKVLSEEWSKLIDKYGYPNVPYDSTKKEYRYEFVFEFDSIEKSIIYNRVLEFLTLKFDYLPDILNYQDYDLGKIILSLNDWGKDSSSKKSTNYYCKYRFTIIDFKMKVEVFNIRLVGEYENLPMDSLYPITKENRMFWEKRFQNLKNINSDIRSTNLALLHFIKDYKKDYEF